MNIDSDPHLRWFKLAKNTSKYSEHRIKVGAVLLRKDKPISVGFNKTKAPNKKFITRFDTTHAEVCALATSGKDYLDKTTMYIYREDKKGNIKMSRPCEYCLAELKKFGVKKIYYTTNEAPYWNMEKI
jgi:tRNA(Arg) A34 adenosine deaminase TadA